MIKLKRMIYEVSLYEGLDITHSKNTSVRMLRDWGRHEKDDSKITVFSDDSDDNDRIYIFIRLSNKDEFDNLLRFINNLGWFISSYNLNGISNKYNYDNVIDLIEAKQNIVLILEAKYDIEVNVKPTDKLYHASPTKNESKILKLGLVPKSKEKSTTHPDRIYLTFDVNDAISIAKKKDFNKGEKMTIFFIDNAKLNQQRKIRFFKDPNFYAGVYIYENIPPEFIFVKNRI